MAIAGIAGMYVGDKEIIKGFVGGVKIYEKRENEDPYWQNVSLFLHTDGSLIKDFSPNPKTLSINGATSSSAQTKYNTNSLFFNGTSNFISTPSDEDFNLGFDDFTIESWIYPLAGNGYRFIVDKYIGFSYNWQLGILNNTINIYIRNAAGNGSFANYSSNQTIPMNQWSHVVYQRKGNIMEFFLDGNKDSNTLNVSGVNFTNNNILAVGKQGNVNDYYYSGYLSYLRITKGIGRYTSNFNPETDTYLAY